tara:strand:+ start:4225 stop:5400 length:1176 start_codon:yes stop_codon:yes gene_type:complete
MPPDLKTPTPSEALLARLVGFATVSRTPNQPLIDFVVAELEAIGARISIDRGPDGRSNLYASLGPADVAGVVLSGHSDVVPVAGQHWTTSPFELTEDGGRLYGRGTADMKGFLACALVALADAAKRTLRTPLHLAISYDEEVGCVGVRTLLEQLATAPVKPKFCIVGEPTSMGVAVGHKGKQAFCATFTGREAHSALAPSGLNAVQLAAEFCLGLQELQNELARHGPYDDGYEVAYSTVHVGQFEGGVALNIVPNEARVTYEIRSVPQQDVNTLCKRIAAIAENIVGPHQMTFAEANVEIENLSSYPGLETPTNEEVVQFVKSLTGANATSKVAFGTEGGLFAEALDVPVVICGPGSMAQGHKPDEYVTREQLSRCDQMLTNLVAALERGV